MLNELRVGEFLAALGERTPTPASGAATALTGALAAALTELAGRFAGDEEAVIGARASQERLDGLLGLAVGLGHRGLVRLDGDLEAAAVVPHGDLAGRLGGPDHRGDDVRDGRGQSCHSPRSTSTSLNTWRASTTTGIPP